MGYKAVDQTCVKENEDTVMIKSDEISENDGFFILDENLKIEAIV
jgi:hypothetical protein